MKKILFIPLFFFLVCPAFAQWNGNSASYPGVTADGANGLNVTGKVAIGTTSVPSDLIAASAFLGDKTKRYVEAHDSDHTIVVVNKGGYTMPIQIGTSTFLLTTATNVDLDTDLDTGTSAAGTDYCVYAVNDSGTLGFKISANTTWPDGYAATTATKIGGFHTLCVAVGTIAGHTLTDYAVKDILPASIWDLKHRPRSAPAGMVYSQGANIWVDIYLASGTGASTASVFGGTISDTRDWNDFVDDFAAVKKKLLDDGEFQIIAAGSNEETNITGSADPVTTGGHVDTAARRMISNIGVEDCAGVMWQWLRDQSYRYDVDVVPTFTAASKTATAYHAASPGGNPIYVKYDTDGSPYLACNMATDIVDKIVTFGSAWTLRIRHDADAATGGYQVYIDEDATQPNRLLCALPGLKTEYLRTSIPTSWLPIVYNAAPATPGVALSFDDGADERMEFISPTTANAAIDLGYISSPAWAWYDLPVSKGSLYRQGSYGDIKLFAGGSWSYGAYCGSRSRRADYSRWHTLSFLGGRGRSEPQ